MTWDFLLIPAPLLLRGAEGDQKDPGLRVRGLRSTSDPAAHLLWEPSPLSPLPPPLLPLLIRITSEVRADI